MNKLMSPYKKGFAAYQEGISKEENPYRKGSTSYPLWGRGYEDSYISEFETLKEFKERHKESK